MKKDDMMGYRVQDLLRSIVKFTSPTDNKRRVGTISGITAKKACVVTGDSTSYMVEWGDVDFV